MPGWSLTSLRCGYWPTQETSQVSRFAKRAFVRRQKDAQRDLMCQFSMDVDSAECSGHLDGDTRTWHSSLAQNATTLRCALETTTSLSEQADVATKAFSCNRRIIIAAGIALSSLGEGEAEAAAPQEAFEGGKVTLLPTTTDLTLSERQVLEINLRVQRQNGAPPDFPVFVRQGFDIKVLADGYTEDSQGLIYKELESGSGDRPVDGQEVTFNYVAYNESGAIIDSSYRKGRPAQTRLGIRGLIPGFELGVKDMNVGGKRRLVVPPELGPPVGPSTFFSAKQCEVFDVELLAVKSCSRRQVAMFSSVVCE
eukprot:jgi/Botrbrau1/6974/Bobra.0165s0010.2